MNRPLSAHNPNRRTFKIKEIEVFNLDVDGLGVFECWIEESQIPESKLMKIQIKISANQIHEIQKDEIIMKECPSCGVLHGRQGTNYCSDICYESIKMKLIK